MKHFHSLDFYSKGTTIHWRVEDALRMDDASEYHYQSDEKLGHHYHYLMDPVMDIISDANPKKIFELGCGKGSFASYLTKKGFDVTGVDPSTEGIRVARKLFPDVKLHIGSAYDDLCSQYGRFPLVVSLEVVEHVYSPKAYANTLFSLVEPGGFALVSTPYHGYAKNLLLALTGKMDEHYTALWDHGHIKFWSIDTLSKLLQDAGFVDITFRRAGRIPSLAKSMIAVAHRSA